MCGRRCLLDHKTNRGMAGNGESSRPSSDLLQCSLPSAGITRDSFSGSAAKVAYFFGAVFCRAALHDEDLQFIVLSCHPKGTLGLRDSCCASWTC